MKRKLLNIAAVLSCLVALAACNPYAEAAVARGHYDSIGPEYSAYVTADENLAVDQKTRRLNNVTAWKIWVESLEGKK